MSNKPLPHNLTTDELLDLLGKDTNQTVQTSADTFLLFLSQYNISPGNHKVPKQLILKLYQYWSKDTVSPSKFYPKANEVLPAETKYYLLNHSSVELANTLNTALKSRNIYRHQQPKLIKHIQEFFEAKDIKRGRYWVEWFQIWYLYDQWTFDNKKANRFNEDSFKNTLALYFDLRWVGQDRIPYLSIHKSILKHLTEQQMEEIRVGRKRSNARKKKAKQEKLK